MTSEPIYALTSFAPGADRKHSRKCLDTWRSAGLVPLSFNHPSEIPALAESFEGVEFVPVEKTSMEHFGKHYIPIKTLTSWAEARDCWALIINADVELTISKEALGQIREQVRGGGVASFRRREYNGERTWNGRIGTADAVLLHGRDNRILADTFLSLGVPWWDIWLPLAFRLAGRHVAEPYPFAMHRAHPVKWYAHSLAAFWECHRIFRGTRYEPCTYSKAFLFTNVEQQVGELAKTARLCGRGEGAPVLT